MTTLWKTTSTEVDTLDLGAQLVDLLPSDAVLLLEGDLGAGKTVIVRGIARALGVEGGEVQSPTFSLIHEHDGRHGRLVHVDLYRLEPGDLDGLGLDELLEGPGLKAVEWAERLPWDPPGAYRLRIEKRAEGRAFWWVGRRP